jgi:hypothetical protein
MATKISELEFCKATVSITLLWFLQKCPSEMNMDKFTPRISSLLHKYFSKDKSARKCQNSE